MDLFRIFAEIRIFRHMKKIVLLVSIVAFTLSVQAQISVDATKTYLVTKKDGKPFFWLGDTAWELFHRLTREEAVHYLNTRQKQQFNVIMAVGLAELEGLHQPNMHGDVPFKNLETLEWAVTPGNNPSNAEEYDYWDHVDFVIQEAAKRNLYIGLLPTWGDKVVDTWSNSYIFTNEDRAYNYAKQLAERYKNQWNVIWILGGDRVSVPRNEEGVVTADYRPIWRAMAKAIQETFGEDVFIAYHARGNTPSSTYLNEESWLSMHSLQSGHGSRWEKPWETIVSDLKLTPKRPVMDMEPCYEDHPMNPWDNKWTRAERGYFDDYDVRARIYRGVFAGGAGTVYGHHHIWQFVDTTRNAPVWIGDTIIGWRNALDAKAANHIHHLKDLMFSRPDFNRIEDNSMVVSDRGSDYRDIIIATRNQKATYAMIYLPQPNPVQVDLNKLSSGRKRVSWFNPVTGKYRRVKGKYSNGTQTFTPPNTQQKDWVLVIDVR